jgi:DNA topoisomerase-1
MRVSTLVIVESSTKAGLIQTYLNSNKETSKNAKFKVIASQGHIRDISSKEKNMGIDTTNFGCKWVVVTGKNKIVKNLKEQIKNAEFVYLATDNDREGEGIAWHLKDYFKLSPNKYKRIIFNEITESALVRAVQNASQINDDMVHSYISRRILDRLVGFMISRLLWNSFDSNVLLTTGRVQGVALKEIIEKENEINAFESVRYWTLLGNFGSNLSDTTLYFKDAIFKELDETKLVELLKLFSKSSFFFKEASLKTVKESAPLPFITSTLQQTAYSSCGFSIKKTMSVAQELYEMGAITYMRTDSTYISDDFKNKATSYINKVYGDQYLGTPTKRKKTSKHAQEAHEAIRPTDIQKSPEFKSDDQSKLYYLIFKRTIASFMASAIYNEVYASVSCDKLTNDYVFIGKEKVLFFEGWLKVYDKVATKLSGDALLSKYYKSGQQLTPLEFIGHCVWTNPPSRYNESSIVNMLEKNGIGRPSTYASILAKLFEKKYIEKKDVEGVSKETIEYKLDIKQKTITQTKNQKKIGNEKSRLVPTTVGFTVNDFVIKTFPQIVNTEFTAKMEDSLDKIATNQVNYIEFLSNFYGPFKTDYDKVLSTIDKNTKPSFKQDGVKHMYKDTEYLVREARYGPVIEYKENNTSKFIPLKYHLKYTKKKLSEIDINDVIKVVNYHHNRK